MHTLNPPSKPVPPPVLRKGHALRQHPSNPLHPPTPNATSKLLHAPGNHVHPRRILPQAHAAPHLPSNASPTGSPSPVHRRCLFTGVIYGSPVGPWYTPESERQPQQLQAAPRSFKKSSIPAPPPPHSFPPHTLIPLRTPCTPHLPVNTNAPVPILPQVRAPSCIKALHSLFARTAS